MGGTHALLSPSSAARWMACTPSARMEEHFPDTTSEAAAEGTAAHELGEALLRKHLGFIDAASVDAVIDSPRVKQYFCAAMLDYADDYAVHVLECFNRAKITTSDAILKIEQKLDVSDYVPESYGTGDAVIIADGVMEIIDLKYGRGVSVSAVENKQMMLYALGALKEVDYMYNISTVRLTIYQPRLDNISSWELSVVELNEWATKELKPRATKAFCFDVNIECRFCSSRAVCRALFVERSSIIDKLDKDAFMLEDDEVAEVRALATSVKSWISAVEDYALREALDNGKQWPGYKLVEGRSNRAYADQDKVAKLLIEQGYTEEIIYNRTLLGITAMEKALTKKTFTSVLGGLIIKPQGKPTLVPLADRRTEWNSAENAADDFKHI